MKKYCLSFLVLGLFAGCASDKPVEEQRPIIPAKIAGSNIPEGDIERIRYGEDVKAYTVGRYIDPVNPKIMYEKNIIYRIEDSSRWNLRPNAEISPPLGKSPRDNLDIQRLWAKEYENELKKQQQLSKSMIATTQTAIQKMQLLEQQNKILLEKISEQDKTIKSLSKDLEKSSLNDSSKTN